MPPTTPELPAGVGTPGNIGMIFLKPWQGYVPGERAGFSVEACNRLYDAGVAKYLKQDMNIQSIPSAMVTKFLQVFGGGGNTAPGVDTAGLPVAVELPPAPDVPGHELLTREPHGSPSGRTGPPPPTPGVAPGPPVSAATGTNWPPPDEAGANAQQQEEAARPDALIGKKRK